MGLGVSPGSALYQLQDHENVCNLSGPISAMKWDHDSRPISLAVSSQEVEGDLKGKHCIVYRVSCRFLPSFIIQPSIHSLTHSQPCGVPSTVLNSSDSKTLQDGGEDRRAKWQVTTLCY